MSQFGLRTNFKLNPSKGGGGGPFDLAAFMAAQADGFYYDFTRTDRHYQDTAGFTLADDTGEAIGLVVDSRLYDGRGVVNRLIRSQEFDQTGWAGFNTTVSASVATAPDGTATADKLGENNAANFHSLDSATIAAVAGAFTSTIYAKAAERRYLRLYVADMTGGGAAYTALFDLQTGAALSTTGTGTVASIQDAGNGWYRCRVSATIVGTSVRQTVLLQATNSSSPENYLGVTGNGVYLWGAQLEFASNQTAYQATTQAVGGTGQHASQATGTLKGIRQAAGCKFDGSDDNELSAYLAQSGANFLGGRFTVPSSLAATQVILGASGSGANRVFLAINTSGQACAGVGSDATGTIVGTSDLRNTQADIFLTFDGSTVRLIVNGAVEYEAAQSGTPTTTIPLRLGALNNNGSAGSWFGGYVKQALVGREFITAARAQQISNALAT